MGIRRQLAPPAPAATLGAGASVDYDFVHELAAFAVSDLLPVSHERYFMALRVVTAASQLDVRIFYSVDDGVTFFDRATVDNVFTGTPYYAELTGFSSALRVRVTNPGGAPVDFELNVGTR